MATAIVGERVPSYRRTVEPQHIPLHPRVNANHAQAQSHGRRCEDPAPSGLGEQCDALAVIDVGRRMARVAEHPGEG